MKNLFVLFTICLIVFCSICNAGIENTFSTKEKGVLVTLDPIDGWNAPEIIPGPYGYDMWRFEATNNPNIFVICDLWEDYGTYFCYYQLIEKYQLPNNSRAIAQIMSITDGFATSESRAITDGILEQSWASHDVSWVKDGRIEPLPPPTNIGEWSWQSSISGKIKIIYLIQIEEGGIH